MGGQVNTPPPPHKHTPSLNRKSPFWYCNQCACVDVFDTEVTDVRRGCFPFLLFRGTAYNSRFRESKTSVLREEHVACRMRPLSPFVCENCGERGVLGGSCEAEAGQFGDVRFRESITDHGQESCPFPSRPWRNCSNVQQIVRKKRRRGWRDTVTRGCFCVTRY